MTDETAELIRQELQAALRREHSSGCEVGLLTSEVQDGISVCRFGVDVQLGTIVVRNIISVCCPEEAQQNRDRLQQRIHGMVTSVAKRCLAEAARALQRHLREVAQYN